jgi:DNA-binding CsgD family transcriptional regulator
LKHNGNSSVRLPALPAAGEPASGTPQKQTEPRPAADSAPPSPACHPSAGSRRLTGRERWIVVQLVKHKGAPNKVVAGALKISPNTLRNHLASIYAKLGVRRRLELVLYAMEHGLDDSRDA